MFGGIKYMFKSIWKYTRNQNIQEFKKTYSQIKTIKQNSQNIDEDTAINKNDIKNESESEFEKKQEPTESTIRRNILLSITTYGLTATICMISMYFFMNSAFIFFYMLLVFLFFAYKLLQTIKDYISFIEGTK